MTIKQTDISGFFNRQIYKYRKKYLLGTLNFLVRLKLIAHGVKVGRNTRFYGFPVVSREQYSEIIFGDNCEFNSSRHSIWQGLFRPCSISTLKKNASIVIGNNSGGTGITILACHSIKIGQNVLIGAYSTIVDTDFHHTDPSKRRDDEAVAKPVIIEDNVFIGFNCFILKGVTIGENSIIGANSVVITDIPPNSIAMGNPCKVIIKRSWT